ncbi:MAG: hypothetical protein WCI77_09240 [Candidatus Omnitrophota bacterium]
MEVILNSLDPAKVILSKIGNIVVSFIVVLIVIAIGWVFAKVIRAAVVRLLKKIKLDDISERINLAALLVKGGITASISELIGAICFWILMLATFLVAVDTVGLQESMSLLNRVILYVPNIIAAIFILVLGMFVATLLNNIVKTVSVNAGISQAILLGKIAQGIVLAFVVAVALTQLRIAERIITQVITIVLGTLGLGVALAFGLGCKDIVAKYVNEFLQEIKRK